MTTRTTQRRHEGAALNATRRSQGKISRDRGGAVVQGTTISFSAASTIADSANQLGALAVGDVIEVRGSPGNSREWRVNTAGAGSISVRPAQIVSEGAGAAITIVRKGS